MQSVYCSDALNNTLFCQGYVLEHSSHSEDSGEAVHFKHSGGHEELLIAQGQVSAQWVLTFFR